MKKEAARILVVVVLLLGLSVGLEIGRRVLNAFGAEKVIGFLMIIIGLAWTVAMLYGIAKLIIK